MSYGNSHMYLVRVFSQLPSYPIGSCVSAVNHVQRADLTPQALHHYSLS